jgi:hypothetical protein
VENAQGWLRNLVFQFSGSPGIYGVKKTDGCAWAEVPRTDESGKKSVTIFTLKNLAMNEPEMAVVQSWAG